MLWNKGTYFLHDNLKTFNFCIYSDISRDAIFINFSQRKHLHKYPAQTKIQYRGLQHFYLQHGRWKIWSSEFECSTDIGMSSNQTFQPPRWSKLTEPTLVKRAWKSMLQHESSRFFKPSKFLWWHSQPGGTADFSNDQ